MEIEYGFFGDKNDFLSYEAVTDLDENDAALVQFPFNYFVLGYFMLLHIFLCVLLFCIVLDVARVMTKIQGLIVFESLVFFLTFSFKL